MLRFWIATIAIAMVLGLSVARAEEKAPEKHKLGRTLIGTYTVSVIMIGDPHEVKAVEFDVKLYDKDASKTPPPDPKALRIWIGAEDVKAADKVALTKGKSTFAAMAPVPAPLAKDAKVWVEVETAAGVSRGSFSMEHEHEHKH
jgi:hypothetical protein